MRGNATPKLRLAACQGRLGKFHGAMTSRLGDIRQTRVVDAQAGGPTRSV